MLPSSVRIYLSTTTTDMRCGFDGLAAPVTASGFDVFSGHLFVCLSRSREHRDFKLRLALVQGLPRAGSFG